MRKLELSDVKNLHEYELIRDDWRRHVIEVKARRRVVLGPKMSLAFENRLTMLHQVQEMCRSERIARPEKVQDELDVYNALLPDRGEVAATLFIEITDEASVKRELDALVGLGGGPHLTLGLAGRSIPARFGKEESRDDRIAAVQYLRFPIGTDPADLEALRSGDEPVVLSVAHPAYSAAVALSPETRAELVRDLTE